MTKVSLWLLLAAGALTIACKREPTVDGPTLFAASCARCHGENGTGGPPPMPGGPSPRNFHDHAFQTERTDAQLEQVIVSGKGMSMPPFGTMFSDAERRALVAHIRSFDSK